MKNLPLYLQIANDIIKSICSGDLKPGERVLSESEICEKYRVSSITAKNALIYLCDEGYIVRVKGKGSFVNSSDMLEKLPEYRISRHKRAIARIKAIGLIVPTMKTKVDKELLNAIELEISKTGYSLLLNITRESQEKESEAIRKFIHHGVSGLIIFPTEKELYNEDILKLSIDQFPFVFVDRYLYGIKANTVTSNNMEITKYAVDLMIKKRGKNIVFVSPNSNNSVTTERVRGFQDALLDNNVPINRDNFCMVDLNIDAPEKKYLYIKSFLDRADNLDGIFCANQEMARLVMQILEDHYPKRIGQLELSCFDGIESRHFSYIRQNIPEIARICVEILVGVINGETEIKNVTVPAEYISAKR